ILLAALDPASAAKTESAPVTPLVLPVNPYDFYGSVGECAAAERTRCEACLAAGQCTPETRDATSGVAECTTLSADGGRGFFLFCTNLSLAIATVEKCVRDRASTCPIVDTAGNQLSALDANAGILDNATCLDSLDGCLASLFGAPNGQFPEPG